MDVFFFVLLPNTPHATRIPLTQTLVLDVEPHLFESLMGNEQGKMLGYGFPSHTLHFYPNFTESPAYKVSIPMTSFPYHKTPGAFAQASVGVASVSAGPASPSSCVQQGG